MKTLKYMSIMLLCFGSMALFSQKVPENLNEAKSSYGSGDLENTRFALQEALNGINQTIGKEILEQLPTTLGDMAAVEGSDDVTGTNMGFANLFVSREFEGESSSATFQVISDSPMLSSVNTLLSMSVFFAADPDQKRIKIDGYKVLQTRSEDEETGVVTFAYQLPFGDSMMNFETIGIAEEKKATGVVEEIPIAEIVATAK